MREVFWFSVAAALLGLASAFRKDTGSISAPVYAPLALPAPSVAPIANPAFGLGMDDNGVYVEDFAAWFESAPQAFEDAIADGAVGAQGVLVHVLRRALPRYKWPPEENSPHFAQFAAMVKKVAEDLKHDPEPEPRPRLSVVS